MRLRAPLAVPAIVSIMLMSGFQAAPEPAQVLAAVARAYLAMSHPADWEGIEALPHIKWAPLPPAALRNCLPEGDCFARQGTIATGGRSLTVGATGARTMVFHLFLRNTAPAGEAAMLAALKEVGLTAELVRCPVKTGAGGTNWYRLKGAELATGILSIQPATAARPTEGLVLSEGEDLPTLPPNQLALYSDRCAPGAERGPVSTVKPHEQLAQTVVSLLVPATGPALHDWKALAGLPSEITWSDAGPKPADLSVRNDPSPLMQPGDANWAGRKFSVMASGTTAQVRNLYLDEVGTHPRGEHMLGVVYQKGIAVRLVRCGPVYTESTNNWYSLTSSRTRPAMVRQSIHYDGNLVSDSYELRLDGSLPPRDPRDRDPGVSGCQ